MWVGGLYGTDLRSRILAVFPAAVLFLSRWRARARWRERKSAEVFSLEHLAPPPLCVHPRGRARRRRGPTCGRTCGRAYTKHAHTLANRLHTFARRAGARVTPPPHLRPARQRARPAGRTPSPDAPLCGPADHNKRGAAREARRARKNAQGGAGCAGVRVWRSRGRSRQGARPFTKRARTFAHTLRPRAKVRADLQSARSPKVRASSQGHAHLRARRRCVPHFANPLRDSVRLAQRVNMGGALRAPPDRPRASAAARRSPEFPAAPRGFCQQVSRVPGIARIRTSHLSPFPHI